MARATLERLKISLNVNRMLHWGDHTDKKWRPEYPLDHSIVHNCRWVKDSRIFTDIRPKERQNRDEVHARTECAMSTPRSLQLPDFSAIETATW